ncbi:MAG: hypothetical protein AAF497_22300 [Planctomycetota bacterium]
MSDQPNQELIHRIFLFQSCLVAFSTALFLIGSQWQLGFFWFAFIAGAFGSSVALLRNVRSQSTEVNDALSESWTITLSPILYGAMLAGMAYFLFVSRILSGVDGDGLLMTNLFPDFDYQSKAANATSSTVGTKLSDF